MKLGKHNVDQMLREMTAEQFLEWQVFGALEPFDEERADIRAGSIVNMLANIHRGKSRKPFTLDQSTLKFGDAIPKAPPVQDWKQMKLLGQMMTAESRGKTRG